jgi:branched-chain amino acid aminotransferase
MLICYNGRFVPAEQPLLPVQNRAFKWGDGVFETIKVLRGRMLLEALHFERLLRSLRLLGMGTDSFPVEQLSGQLLELCSQNDLLAARVRLAVFREEGQKPGYVIETHPLDGGANEFNEKGWVLGMHPFVRKSRDAFSNCKTASFLPYVMAGLYAVENDFDEVLVLNSDNQVCDGSKTNVFLVRGNEVFTPALTSGCVGGVMRLYLVEQLKALGIGVHQEDISEEALLQADEVFCTNAIAGMRWVSRFRHKSYGNGFSAEWYRKIIQPLLS